MEAVITQQYWQIIHSTLQEIWAITEPQIEDAAVRYNTPIELYYYAELGLDYFSVAEFQRRDPFSNPEQFEKLFARLDVKGVIVPTRDEGRYQVSEGARNAVRRIVQAGDDQLLKFESVCDLDLDRLLSFLKQIVLANNAASEPPEKWAVATRFHTATRHSPHVIQIRECLMDLYAYRDDSHLAAARPYFNEAGIVWSAFICVCNGQGMTAEKIAETQSFRGYEAEDYAPALEAAVDAGWIEATQTRGEYRPTDKGKEMREQVEKLTDEYFYRPWAMLSTSALDEFHDLLLKLRDQLHGFRKSI